MFVIKKKSQRKSMAEYSQLRTSCMYLGCYFVAIRALYLFVNRKNLS